MLKKERVFTKKKALILVAVCALILLCLLLIRWHSENTGELMTPQGRQKFLESLGWEIDLSSEEEKTVIIPEKFEGVMEDYNKMQQEQGLNLAAYSGQQCKQYTYSLLNHPDVKENVYISVYIKDSRLIAGDIHTNSVNGFMQGIIPPDSAK